MKILFLSPTFPLPANTGAKRRIYHILKELSRSNNLHLISIVHQQDEYDYINNLSDICEAIYPFKLNKSKTLATIQTLFSLSPYRVNKLSKHKAFGEKVNQLIRENEFDIIWVHCMNMGVYLDPSSLSDQIVILDQHNIDELVWKKLYENSDNIMMNLFGRLNEKREIRLRNKLTGLFDVILSVCQEDAEYTRRWAPDTLKIWETPNGVDIEYFKPSEKPIRRENVIMFCGAMDVTMNIDAVERFANEVFPKVKQEMPDSEFWVVGKDPMKKVKALGSQQGIKITGTVEDVRPYYEEATLFVAPFRFGGGTKLKILEAMAMGIPIISTDVGCQGIEVVNGEHVIIENNLNNFAPKIMHLLNCKEERKMISKNARYLVEEKYSWKGIISNIERKIRDLVKEKDDFKQKCHHFNVPSQAQNSAASKRSSVEHDLTMFN